VGVVVELRAACQLVNRAGSPGRGRKRPCRHSGVAGKASRSVVGNRMDMGDMVVVVGLTKR